MLRFFYKNIDEPEDEPGEIVLNQSLLVELPQTGPGNPCPCPLESVATYTIPNSFSGFRTLDIRYRGVCEFRAYTGGTYVAPIYVDGTFAANTYNWIRVEVSNPVQTYWLNPDDYAFGVNAVSFLHSISVAGGAVITLTFNSVDLQETPNPGLSVPAAELPLLVAQPYAGQFWQADLLTVRL